MLRLVLAFVFLACFCLPIDGYKTAIDVLSEDSRFSSYLIQLQHHRLVPYVNSIKTGTFFAPTNDAFVNYTGEISTSMLYYHMLSYRMNTGEFIDGALLDSLYELPELLGPDHPTQPVKVTRKGFPGLSREKIMINGVSIVTKDIPVNNGTVIHAVDRILVPPAMLDVHLEHYSVLWGWMKQLGIDTLLREARPYTVFVSRSDVFSKFNKIEQRYITSVNGTEDLTKLLRYMVVEGVLYAKTFPVGTSSYKTLSGELLYVAKDTKDQLTVNGVRVAEKDLLAANGVIHELEETVVPQSIVFNARKYLVGLNATVFVELLDQYGLGGYLDAPAHPYSFLVPTNQALIESRLPENKMADWLQYHILNGSWFKEDFTSSRLLSTEFRSKALKGAYQKLPVFVESESALDTTGKTGKSIHFGRARVIGETVTVQENVLYQISESLVLPSDVLGTLVTDFDLSMFIASLYVSKVVTEVIDASGMTLFVPTNKAFEGLGLIAKYLMHSSAKQDLRSVLRYHAVDTLLYHETLLESTHDVITMENTTLHIAPTPQGQLAVSQPDGSRPGLIGKSDILVSNGVVHIIDGVQIPDHVKISSRQLLKGIEATTMLELLEKAQLIDEIDKKDCIVLAPSNKAFSQVDLEALIDDPYELARVVRLHLIPKTWQDTWLQEVRSEDGEYPTLLSEWDKLMISESAQGKLLVEVKGQPDKKIALVTGMGKAYTGGGVLEIDTVLTPIRRGFFGLPWLWSMALVGGVVAVACGLTGLCGFFIYKIWSRRRLGYRAI
ncbi:FAS1 domain-containing protein [Spinellus fusiger]|nr:FAS1 domain-containing protein [Spinellus fusiger]